ncbi:MAG: UDP-N-acetylglucosamine 4,6-dehydratase [Parcubacteria group bacterium Gr01-1014_66]|nr:MAG: UDP-N-acetylglucosamine 4,6-dehydratase [Parcubacteria group bacterium Gr01-1014_66]
MNAFLLESRILVTGGTGTFGSAFVQHLLRIPQVQRIVVFSRDEYKQSKMRESLTDPRLRFFLGDVRDQERLMRAFQDIDIVVHAAALKQVPALEYNPLEAIKTNIIGTENVINAALDNNVAKVLFISSDKAVHPVNLYGATKLCAEKLCVAANVYRGQRYRTRFSVMRYGNVIGSRGSFVEQIEHQRKEGVIMLTDERMTRFWIALPRIMELATSTLGEMHGGEIFVPKMQSAKVVDVIQLLAPGCRINTIGMRHGEKLHEVLITDQEIPRTLETESFFIITPAFGKEFGWTNAYYPNASLVKSHFIYASDHPELLVHPTTIEGLMV